jgi:hypothetical protein
MKRFIPVMLTLIILLSIFIANEYTARAETVLLSGNPISLEILSAAAATDLADSIEALHANALVYVVAVRDSVKNTHTNLLSRIIAVRDSVSNTHKNSLIYIDTAMDTTTSAHSNILALTLAETTAIEDTLTDVHGALKIFELATGDTLTDLHGAVKIFESATADTLTDVHEKIEILDSLLDDIQGATGVFNEQADVPITVTALADSETTVLNLRTADTRFLIRNLRIKSADPGANTCTVRLYEFINDVFVSVDTFEITTANFTNYFNLYDLFGETQLAGDNFMITVGMDAGTAAITGQYSYAKTNN